MNREKIEERARAFAESVKGMNHRKTAAHDFMAGVDFAIANLGFPAWRDAVKDPPQKEVRVLVKREGCFLATGKLTYNTEKKRDEWHSGGSLRAWNVTHWMPLPDY